MTTRLNEPLTIRPRRTWQGRPMAPNWPRIGLLALNLGLWLAIALMIRFFLVKGV